MLYSSTIAVSTFLAIANAGTLTSKAATGIATYYGGNINGGTCSFTGYTIPSGLYGVAMTDSSWDNAKTCGACISVTGPQGNTITAMVVDQCPGCGLGHLDLFPDAFAKLDDIKKGEINVSWEYVNCPITSPIQVRSKEGVSPFWFSMQVINANKRVESLQFSTNGGKSWVTTQRQPYNYFQYSSGSGTSTVDVKITSVNGDVLVIKNVAVSPGKIVPASSNFGPSGAMPASKELIPEVNEPIPAKTQTEAPPVFVAPTTPAAIFQEYPVAIASHSPTTFVTVTSKSTPSPVEATTAAPSAPPPSAKPEPTVANPNVSVIIVTISACRV